MRSMITYLLVVCSVTFGLPGLSSAQVQAVDAPEKATLAALNQPALLQEKAGGPPAALPGVGPAEQASLAALGAQKPDLLKQSAGERVIVVERRRRPYAYVSLGAVILVAVIVTLIVVGAGPGYRRY